MKKPCIGMKINEPLYDKINTITCSSSEDSDQAVHLPTLHSQWETKEIVSCHWLTANTLIRLE